MLDDVDALIAMAQMSAIELHAWRASDADPLHPDWPVFDLDPGEGVAFEEVIRAAHDVRERLKRIGFEFFPRTTGRKGLHLVLPIKPRPDWEQAEAFARAFAEAMSHQEPKRFLSTERRTTRTHSDRLSAQRTRQYRGVFVLPPRPAGCSRRGTVVLA